MIQQRGLRREVANPVDEPAGEGGQSTDLNHWITHQRPAPRWAFSAVILVGSLLVSWFASASVRSETVFVCLDGYTNRYGLYFRVLVLTTPLTSWGLWRIVKHGAAARDVVTRPIRVAATLVLLGGLLWPVVVVARLPHVLCYD